MANNFRRYWQYYRIIILSYLFLKKYNSDLLVIKIIEKLERLPQFAILRSPC